MSAETIQRLREEFEAICIELFRSLNCDIVGIAETTDALQDAPLAYIDAGSQDRYRHRAARAHVGFEHYLSEI